jgi:aminoglycoside/choline kinase family phosphotransferase
MGVQRQIKVLGIFARLCYRDGKDAYLNDMPRVMATCAAPASATANCAARALLDPSTSSRPTSATPSDEGDDPRGRPR